MPARRSPSAGVARAAQGVRKNVYTRPRSWQPVCGNRRMSTQDLRLPPPHCRPAPRAHRVTRPDRSAPAATSGPRAYDEVMEMLVVTEMRPDGRAARPGNGRRGGSRPWPPWEDAGAARPTSAATTSAPSRYEENQDATTWCLGAVPCPGGASEARTGAIWCPPPRWTPRKYSLSLRVAARLSRPAQGAHLDHWDRGRGLVGRGTPRAVVVVVDVAVHCLCLPLLSPPPPKSNIDI
jgi:hypothetical protein